MTKKNSEEGMSKEELNKSLEKIEGVLKDLGDSEEENVEIKASKDISKIKKGDKIKVDNMELEVDSHYVMIDHGGTKEMVIELFDPKKDKDYQLRYFSGKVESSIEFFELEEIIYVKKKVKKIEW